MAYFDRERGEVVVRLVYDGPATAGKTANLRSLHSTFGQRATGELYAAAETATGRTLYFDWIELMVGHLDDWPLRCQILTVPGQLAFAERRFQLLRELDAAVLVCESTPRGVRAARVAWAFLGKALASTGNAGVPVIVQANKQDIEGSLPPSEVASLLALGERQRILPASALRGDGVRATFLTALDAAREALRPRVRLGGPEALPVAVQSAEQLYQAMLAESDAPPDPAMVLVLEEVLGLIHPS